LVYGSNEKVSDARTLANQIALLKAMRTYQLRRVLTFHSTVEKSVQFTKDLSDCKNGTMTFLPEGEKLLGGITVNHIDGHTPAGDRAQFLKALEELPSDSWGVLSNCACLGVGVDLPALDGVAFMDPKKSEIDIVQAVGRVMRKSPGKEIGTIFIPVYLKDGKGGADDLENSEFSKVWKVLRALRAHDETLAQYIDQVRMNVDGVIPTPVDGKAQLPDNFKLDLPDELHERFVETIQLKAIQAASEKPGPKPKIVPLKKEPTFLNYSEIIEDVRKEKESIGKFPTPKTDKKWAGIDHAIHREYGTVQAKYRSLYDLIRIEFDPPLPLDFIKIWARDHKKNTGILPTKNSGQVLAAPHEDWGKIDEAFRFGYRGLYSSGYHSLQEFLSSREFYSKIQTPLQ
jgi:hypothetical protein